jgi:hypothetical protein
VGTASALQYPTKHRLEAFELGSCGEIAERIRQKMSAEAGKKKLLNVFYLQTFEA